MYPISFSELAGRAGCVRKPAGAQCLPDHNPTRDAVELLPASTIGFSKLTISPMADKHDLNCNGLWPIVYLTTDVGRYSTACAL